MNDFEMTEREKKALAEIILADPHPEGGALALVFFGIVTIAKTDPIVFGLDLALGEPEVTAAAWFDGYLKAAVPMAGTLAIDKFGIDPATFPARLSIFLDRAGFFIPAFFVADRLIVWGSRDGEIYATDKPARASEMLAAIAQAEGVRMGAALQ